MKQVMKQGIRDDWVYGAATGLVKTIMPYVKHFSPNLYLRGQANIESMIDKYDNSRSWRIGQVGGVVTGITLQAYLGGKLLYHTIDFLLHGF